VATALVVENCRRQVALLTHAVNERLALKRSCALGS